MRFHSQPLEVSVLAFILSMSLQISAHQATRHRRQTESSAAAIPEANLVNTPTQSHSGIIRFPDVGKTQIVFVYAGDLWLVSRAGGTAVPLAIAPGSKSYPKFSPDGQTIGFTGDYDGVYTIPVAGGT